MILQQIPQMPDVSVGTGLVGMAIVQVGGIALAYVRGRRGKMTKVEREAEQAAREAEREARRREHAEITQMIRDGHSRLTSKLGTLADDFNAHAIADATAFAEIANAFTEIEGTEKLRQHIHEEMVASLAVVARDVAEINRRDLARLERQADASDRRKP